jgi:phosphoadenosine phosphosulfate reductase
MALMEETLFGTVDKVQIAIDRLKAFEPADGYWLAFSGGKDSVVIKRLAQMAGVKFEAHYSVTSVDPPELVRFIKDVHPDVSFDIPRDKNGKPITMWNLIPKKGMPPTRTARYCCKDLKESSGKGRVTVTGVRWAESANRKNNQGGITLTEKGIGSRVLEYTENFTQTNRGGVVLNLDNDDARRVVEQCYRTTKTLLNPIIDWSDDDVWEFIKTENVSYCSLYDCGYKRLGCIGCPQNVNNEEELDANPKFKRNYIKAFDRMLLEKERKGLASNWKTGEEVMDWWLHGGSDSDELTLLDDMEDEE